MVFFTAPFGVRGASDFSVMEAGVGDMYKGKLSAAQLTNLKNLWKNKRQSDVTPSVKSYVKGLSSTTRAVAFISIALINSDFKAPP